MKGLLLFVAAVVLAGCATAPPDAVPETAWPEYEVRLALVEGPVAAFREVEGLVYGGPAHGVSGMLSDAAFRRMLEAETISVRYFPTVQLTPGTERTLNEQKSFKYATAFDASGAPVSFALRDVGMKVRVSLKDVENGFARIGYEAESVPEPEYRENARGRGRVPIFNVRNSRSVNLVVSVAAPSWVLAGTASGTDGQVTAFAVQVTE